MSSDLPKARGILKEERGFERFQLFRQAPSEALSPWIENYWAVRWDLRDLPPYVQETLPHPSVNISIESGKSRIVGVCKGKFSYTLEGAGVVFGAKFHPGAFVGIWDGPIATLTDQSIPLGQRFGADAASLEAEMLDQPDETAMVGVMEAFLLDVLKPFDAVILEIRELVQLLASTPTLCRVEELASHTGRSARTLQRLFRHYVGVSPKWVIKRYRLHEAAAQIAATPSLDLCRLAVELGYFDQAHFIKDFKSIIGVAPSVYVRQL